MQGRLYQNSIHKTEGPTMDDRKLYNIWCENAKEDNDLIEELKSI